MRKKTTCIFNANDKDYSCYELSIDNEFVTIQHENYPFTDIFIQIPISEWIELNDYVNEELKKINQNG